MLVASVITLSSICFSDTPFLCPSPDSIQAVPATHPYPPSPGFNYVAVDEAGVSFQSVNSIIGNAVPPIVSFDGASFFAVGTGRAHCLYRDGKGGMQTLIAKISGNVLRYEGSAWTQDPIAPFYDCNSHTRNDCTFMRS